MDADTIDGARQIVELGQVKIECWSDDLNSDMDRLLYQYGIRIAKSLVEIVDANKGIDYCELADKLENISLSDFDEYNRCIETFGLIRVAAQALRNIGNKVENA